MEEVSKNLEVNTEETQQETFHRVLDAMWDYMLEQETLNSEATLTGTEFDVIISMEIQPK